MNPADVLNQGMATFIDRAKTHGDYRDSWSAIAGVWSDYLTLKNGVRVELNSRDALHLMALMKVFREAAGGPNFDNPLDAMTYEAMAATVNENP